ncbi:AT-rich interactive domain-containing protein 3 [Abeliophyllum distichum]|uniref:AT-rich interactive domain-containing protein 3 n=1 Tax=Abeliophyllum distichum TaxID=126358 RepID=A0ABD1TIN3_9LAMI
MEDNNDAIQHEQDATDAGAGAAIDGEKPTQVVGQKFSDSKDMEVDNEHEREDGEYYAEIATRDKPETGRAEVEVYLVEGKGHVESSCGNGDANSKELHDHKGNSEGMDVDSCKESNSGCFVLERASSEVRADEKHEESNILVPEVLASAESCFQDKELSDVLTETEVQPVSKLVEELNKPQLDGISEVDTKTPSKTFLLDANDVAGDESGTEEEQTAFMKELETFHRERCLEFKPPRFYQEPLNCLKLWRAVIRLGGYEQVTSLKLWRQVGESFRPPKTCTTVSWTFRGFYEKALLEYEKHKMRSGELPFTDASLVDPGSGNQVCVNQASGSGRARRDAAARAMQGWHAHRLLGSGEVADPIIKDKNPVTTPKREKQLKNIGLPKRKRPSPIEHDVKVGHIASKTHSEAMVVDIGTSADWVKVNVQRTKDCYEVYALVPGLLREEVRVQSDPAGRLVISGQPEQLDNPWGVTPFKKVVTLPTRIDPHQTSAVVTLHGQLFVRVPFEQSDM